MSWMVQKQECAPFCLQYSCIQASKTIRLGAHTHREEKANLYKYLNLVQRSSHVMRELAPIAQEVLAPFAELTPIMARLVLLVPVAELGCKSWLPQGYGHELLPSAHPASQNKSAVAVNRLKVID